MLGECPCENVTFRHISRSYVITRSPLAPAPAVDGLADVWAAMAHNKLHKLRINIMKTINDGIADRQTFAFDLAQMLQVF